MIDGSLVNNRVLVGRRRGVVVSTVRIRVHLHGDLRNGAGVGYDRGRLSNQAAGSWAGLVGRRKAQDRDLIAWAHRGRYPKWKRLQVRNPVDKLDHRQVVARGRCE